ncbi:uncharacterized protein O3Q21_006287 [Podargus strigoides]
MEVRPAAPGRAAALRVTLFAVLLVVCCRAAPERIRYAIPEELGRGSLVGPLARDLGLSPADLPARKLRIVSGDEKQYFTLGEDNKNLRVNERIDREGICGAVSPCVLSLEAVVENPFNIFHVSVTIQDINDNSPQFDREFVAIEMIESTPPGARYPLGSGRDPDIGANSLQNYQLTPNPLFSLSVRESPDGTKQPQLVLEKSLDREKQRNHHLILTAVDGGDPVRTGTAQIKINVTDANDNPPVFTKEIYKIRLLENMPEGSLAFQVKATDGDEGINAEITYSFSDITSSARQLFTLDSRTGDVNLTGQLDYEEGRYYEATVEGKDGGGLSAHAKVHIEIRDVNDNVPTISLLPILNPIPEDTVPSTVVAVINVRDRDSGDNGEVSCNIDDDLPFRLEPTSENTYKLVTASALDRENVSTYNITVTARDGGSPSLSSRAALVLEVSDVNDNAPVFEEAAYSAYVAENNAAGAAVARVQARDADAGANGRVSYWLAGGSAGCGAGAAPYVSVEARSGAVYAQRSFDYEQCREFAVAVRAQDGGAPARSSTATVRVFVLDRNDNAPRVLWPAAGAGPAEAAAAPFEVVPRSAEAGYLVAKVVAVDADAGRNAWLSYELVQAAEPALFRVGLHSGEVRTARAVSERDAAKQRLVAVVKDHGQPALSATATLHVVLAESLQEALPELSERAAGADSPAELQFYLVLALALLSALFLLSVALAVLARVRGAGPPAVLRCLGAQRFSVTGAAFPADFCEGTLPYSYNLCVAPGRAVAEGAWPLPPPPLPSLPAEELLVGEPCGKRSPSSSTGAGEPPADPDAPQVCNPCALSLFSLSLSEPPSLFPWFFPRVVGMGMLGVRPSSRSHLEDQTRHGLAKSDSGRSPLDGTRCLGGDGAVPASTLPYSYNLCVAPGRAVAESAWPLPPPVPSLPAEELLVGEPCGKRSPSSSTGAGEPPADPDAPQVCNPYALSLFSLSLSEPPSLFPWFFPRVKGCCKNDSINGTDEFHPDVFFLRSRAGDSGQGHCRSFLTPGELWHHQDEGIEELTTRTRSGEERMTSEQPERLLLQCVLRKVSSGETPEGHGRMREEMGSRRRWDAVSRRRWCSPRELSMGHTGQAASGSAQCLQCREEAAGAAVDRGGARGRPERCRQPRPLRHGSLASWLGVRAVCEGPRGAEPCCSEAEGPAAASRGRNGSREPDLWEAAEISQRWCGAAPAMRLAGKPWVRRERALLWVVLVSAWEAAWGQLRYSVPEEMPKGSFVGDVAKDLGLQLTALRGVRILDKGRTQYFSFNGKTGYLVTAERIDREQLCESVQQCVLRCEVIVEGEMQIYEIEVEITDINDNAPSFKEIEMEERVSETTAPGSQFPLARAHDPDVGSNSLRSYELSGDDHFSLAVQAGPGGDQRPVLVLAKALDREEAAFHELVLRASDGGEPARTGTTRIRVAVLDANDNAPVFSQAEYTVRVPEDVAVGFVLISLTATDADEGMNGNVKYLFQTVSVKALAIFELDAVSGSITLLRSLDFEEGDSYELEVQARDGGDLFDTAKVEITVMDVNDNAPELTVSSVLSAISEDAPAGTVVALLHVEDRDSGANGEVRCSITERLPFRLEKSFKDYYRVVTARELDREEVSEYNVTVRASDGGSPPLWSSAVVALRVLDVNDNAPVFAEARYSARVPENNAAGALVLTVRAWDADWGQNARVRYRLWEGRVRGAPLSSYVSVQAETGALYALRSFDYEEVREVRLWVRAEDGGAPALSSNVSVRLEIVDENDNAPQVLYPPPASSASGWSGVELAPRSSEPGALVAKVVAVDADAGQNAWLSYELARATEPGLFRVGLHSGEVRTARFPLARDAARQSLVVVVKDHGRPALSATATLTLVLAESVAELLSELGSAAEAAAAPGEAAGSLTRWLVVAVAAVSCLFLAFLLLLLALCLRRWRRSQLLAAGSGALRGVPASHFVGIDGVRAFLHSYSHEVSLTADSRKSQLRFSGGSCCDTLPARPPPDEPAALLGEDPAGGCLADPATSPVRDLGAVRGWLLKGARALLLSHFSVHLQYHSICKDFDLRNTVVYIFHLGIVHLHLKHRMLFGSKYWLALKNHAQHPCSFTHVKVRVSRKRGRQAAAMASRRLRVPLLAETERRWGRSRSPSRQLQRHGQQRSLPSGGPCAACREQPEGRKGGARRSLARMAGGQRQSRRRAAGRVLLPALLLGLCCRAAPERIRYAIPEELGRGSLVGPLARDLGLSPADLPARKLRVASAAKKQLKYFTVSGESGNLYVSDRLDREELCGESASCSVSFEALVQNPLNVFSVEVAIQDVNDNSPRFLQDTFQLEINEFTSPGARFVLGVAEDADVGSNSLQGYELEANGYFEVEVKERQDGNKFAELVLRRALDRESEQSLRLVLTALDGGDPPRSGTAQLCINVTDANDNPPVFAQERYRVSLREDAPPGSTVLNVSASDADVGTNARITYGFGKMLAKVLRKFAMDAASGSITLQEALDFEDTRTFSLGVEARDGGGLVAHCEVEVEVLDVNDNAPEITMLSVSSPVPEDAPAGTVVALVNVKDPDSGENGEVCCELSGEAPLSIVASSGGSYKVVTSSALDREQVAEHRVTVVARDGGSPSLSSRAALVLEVSDVNDNAPVFEEAAYSAYVAENNAAGAAVARVQARDADAGANGRVSYWLAGGSAGCGAGAAPYVSVEARSGAVYAQRSFDYEQCREFAVAVRAQDGGAPARSSTATVRVFVLDRNDNAPRVLWPAAGAGPAEAAAAAPFEVVPRSAEAGYLVAKVVAVDADAGRNAWLSYELVQAAEPALFRVGLHSGEVRTARAVSERDAAKQRLVAVVKDHGQPALSATATLHVVLAESLQEALPELSERAAGADSPAELQFYLVLALALLSALFLLSVALAVLARVRGAGPPAVLRCLGAQRFSVTGAAFPADFCEGTLPYSYNLCVAPGRAVAEGAWPLPPPLPSLPAEELLVGEPCGKRSPSSSTGAGEPPADPDAPQVCNPYALSLFSLSLSEPPSLFPCFFPRVVGMGMLKGCYKNDSINGTDEFHPDVFFLRSRAGDSGQGHCRSFLTPGELWHHQDEGIKELTTRTRSGEERMTSEQPERLLLQCVLRKFEGKSTQVRRFPKNVQYVMEIVLSE